MHPTHLFVPILLSSVLALSQTSNQVSPGPWYVKDYKPGCGDSPAGCSYSFNISYTPAYGSSEPAFCTFCEGTNIQGGLTACVDRSVSSNEIPGFLSDTLLLQHIYTVGEARYTVMGNVTVTDFETESQSFVVIPNVITAVA